GGIITELLGATEEKDPQVFRAASPLTYVKKEAARRFPAFLFIHGDSDTLVDISQSRDMNKALCGEGCESDLIEVHNGNHGLMFGDMHPTPVEFRRRMFAFLKKHLKQPVAATQPVRP